MTAVQSTLEVEPDSATPGGDAKRADDHSASRRPAHWPRRSSGVVYCFYLDWRRGLLALTTIPVYVAVYAWLGRDAVTQMKRLDRGVERISATIVEFIAGVSVVKT